MKKIKLFIREVKIRSLLVMTGLSFLLNYFAKLWLDYSQEKSLYPVPFFEGQLSFSSNKLEEYFAHMINQGTFNIYIQTQLIDFLFLISIIVLHTLVAILFFKLIYRANSLDFKTIHFNKVNLITKLAILNMIIAPFAGFFDAIENFTLFVIFFDPLNVNIVLANMYSIFAVFKFTVFSITYLWFIFATVYLLVINLKKLIKKHL